MEAYHSSIFKVIEYIESRLHEEITLEELSHEAAFSKYHFARIFKAITKETIYEYIRKRRLTVIAQKLIEGDKPIFQIALQYGYGSQEAFSRAFKSYMGTSPFSYRKNGKHYENLYKHVLSNDLLQKRSNPIIYKTSIIEKAGFYIAGIPLTDNVNNHTISKHWNTFYEELRKQHIDPDTAKCYGYETIHNDCELVYIAAIQVNANDHLPQHWTLKYIPSHKYAAVSLFNNIEYIPAAMEQIYQNELPSLHVKPALDFSLEVYPEDFKANDSTSIIQYLIPVI